MNQSTRLILLFGITVLFWTALIQVFNIPDYLLPSPKSVLLTLIHQALLIFQASLITLLEIIISLILATLFGIFFAICMIAFKGLRYWFLPLLLISQALPTFAIAPLLVLWLGYGISSKILVTILMIFFPITSACYDGLKSTPKPYLELAYLMQSSRWRLLWSIRFRHALPSLGTGLRVAATIAPLGAVIAEWVGSSQGLGYLLLNANARMQTDLVFAVLAVITTLTMSLYFLTNYGVNRWLKW